jgi:two-component system response regulator ChvI
MGADDYITKPFSQRLLLARIKAVFKAELVMRHHLAQRQILFRMAILCLDPERHLCSWKEVEVKLTVT